MDAPEESNSGATALNVEAQRSPSGWFPYGAPAKVAQWDGHIWTGARAAAPSVGQPPKWQRTKTPEVFTWLWLLVAGQMLCVLSAIVVIATRQNFWAWTSGIGYVVFMAGAVLLAGRFLNFSELPRVKNLIVLGVISGIVASVIAIVLETLSVDHEGIRTTLWLAGPIEETAKLLIPVLLLFFGSSRFKDPKTGLFLVICSGATFGAFEGTVWEVRTNEKYLHLMMSLLRPGVELFHPFVTGFAAAVIWLAASRAKKSWTKIGVLSYLLVVAFHSAHDGIADFAPTPKGQHGIGVAPVFSASKAIIEGLVGGVAGWGISLMLFVLLRHSARELVAPTSLPTTPPRWRPRIKQWGYVEPMYAHGPEKEAD
jgi:hypothetical protein